MLTHYLPRKYLSRFSIDSSSQMVWQYDRREHTFKCLPIPVVGAINDWFDPETERQLASIEGAVMTAMDKLVDNHEQLDEGEKEAICTYIATMIQRGLSSRVYSEAVAIDNYKGLKESPGFIGEVLAAGWDPRDLFELFAQDGTREKLIADISQKVFELPKVQDIFSRMRWTVLLADGDRHFITSDTPVFYDKAKWTGSSPSDLTIPIASQAVLYLRREDSGHSIQAIDFRQADDRIQVQLNRRAVYYSTRFTFSSRNDPWVKELSDNKRLPVMRLARLWSDPRLS